ncbi:hypothetical protein AADEFJLK_02394 [Methylovulum psychrotolerans]|uniref:Uncharacterized protein n=1 Tax=Methylovulum psychrotolerans TaxID=1704499 RepID=A0A2S5CL59_9GAMM|nr:hypothetical protein AADEFJLK_02394 [Methylovulum psychrotolerans]
MDMGGRWVINVMLAFGVFCCVALIGMSLFETFTTAKPECGFDDRIPCTRIAFFFESLAISAFILIGFLVLGSGGLVGHLSQLILPLSFGLLSGAIAATLFYRRLSSQGKANRL